MVRTGVVIVAKQLVNERRVQIPTVLLFAAKRPVEFRAQHGIAGGSHAKRRRIGLNLGRVGGPLFVVRRKGLQDALDARIPRILRLTAAGLRVKRNDGGECRESNKKQSEVNSKKLHIFTHLVGGNGLENLLAGLTSYQMREARAQLQCPISFSLSMTAQE